MKKLFLISAICFVPNFLMAAENALLVLQNQEKASDKDSDYDEYNYDLDRKEIVPLFEIDFSDYFKQIKEESEKRVYKEVQPYNVGEELYDSWLKGMEKEGAIEQKYQQKKQKKKLKEIERENDPRSDLEILFDESRHIVVHDNKVVDEEQHDENPHYFYTFVGEEKKSDDEFDIAIDENDGKNVHRKSIQEYIANLYQNATNCSVM